MKIKLLNLSIIFTLIMMSCGSDDSESDGTEIIGTWTLNKQIDFFNGTENILTIDECSKTSNVIFESNGNYRFSDYKLESETCTRLYYNTTGNWVYNSGIYSITSDIVCAEETGLSSEQCQDENSTMPIITFKDNKLIFTYEGEIEDGELIEYTINEYLKSE